MRECEHCAGLSAGRILVEGRLLCKACVIQLYPGLWQARQRHPAGKQQAQPRSA